MKINAILLAFVMITMLFTSCGEKTVTDERFYMDTFISVQIPKTENSADILNDVYDNIAALEAQLSRTADGDVRRFNDSESGVEISPECADIVKIALDVAANTDGAFDPTTEPIVTLWDIAHGQPKLPTEAEISTALESVGYKKISLDGLNLTKTNPSVKLDLGGIGKGYACQRAIETLRAAGLDYGMVSFGGNVAFFGEKPDGSEWKIGVRDPFDTDGVAGYLYLNADSYISVSGDYERYFELDGKRYHHIFDPATGKPSESGIHSAAVITGADRGAECDALSTAIFVMGLERAKELYNAHIYDFEAVIIADGETFVTDGLKDIYEPME